MHFKRVISLLAAGILGVSAMSVSTSAAYDNNGTYHNFSQSFYSNRVSVSKSSYYAGISGTYVWLYRNGHFYSCASGRYKGSGTKGNGYGILDGSNGDGGGSISGSLVKHDGSFMGWGCGTKYTPTYIAPAYTETPVLSGNYSQVTVRGTIYWK